MIDGDTFVTLPLSQLSELLKAAQNVPELQDKVSRLTNQVEGLHCLYRELMLKLAERK